MDFDTAASIAMSISTFILFRYIIISIALVAAVYELNSFGAGHLNCTREVYIVDPLRVDALLLLSNVLDPVFIHPNVDLPCCFECGWVSSAQAY